MSASLLNIDAAVSRLARATSPGDAGVDIASVSTRGNDADARITLHV